jgi:hypothetical protein
MRLEARCGSGRGGHGGRSGPHRRHADDTGHSHGTRRHDARLGCSGPGGGSGRGSGFVGSGGRTRRRTSHPAGGAATAKRSRSKRRPSSAGRAALDEPAASGAVTDDAGTTAVRGDRGSRGGRIGHA